jgi:hypothetical protein
MAKTMKKGVNNISIFTPNDVMRDKLKEGWRKIAKEHEWPKGSDKITHCEFQCLIQLRPAMDFCWDDYKGGILNSYDEISQKERTEFYKYLENSAGLIFCVPSDTITRILNDDDDAIEELEDLNDFIFKSVKIIKNIPVTVAITKSDLLENENAKQVARKIIKEELNALFDEGNQISVLLVPVTLGEGLGEGEQGGRITKGVINADPKEGHIHLPVMFNLYFALKDYIKEKNDALIALESDLNIDSGRLSTAKNHNALQRFFKGESIDNLQSNLSYLRKRINEEKEDLRVLNTDLEKVRNEFTNDCEYYVNGKLQKF